MARDQENTVAFQNTSGEKLKVAYGCVPHVQRKVLVGS